VTWKLQQPQLDVARLAYTGPPPPVETLNLTAAQRPRVGKALGEDVAVRMLTFDWSNDPMFHGKPERLEKLRAAQTQALKKIGNGRTKHERIMYDFVLESGLFQTTAESLNMPGLVPLAEAMPRP